MNKKHLNHEHQRMLKDQEMRRQQILRAKQSLHQQEVNKELEMLRHQNEE